MTLCLLGYSRHTPWKLGIVSLVAYIARHGHTPGKCSGRGGSRVGTPFQVLVGMVPCLSEKVLVSTESEYYK